MLPQIAPSIAEALGEAKLITMSQGEKGAPETTTNNIVSVIQTVLAAQMVAKGGLLGSEAAQPPSNGATPVQAPSVQPGKAPNEDVPARRW